MIDDFLLRTALAALGVALTASVLGVFVIWRRMAYFGDATSHAALLGVALALAFDGPVVLGVLLVAITMALLLFWLTDRGHGADASLGVLAHGGLAAGFLAVSVLPGARGDLEAYLFGDVLTVTGDQLQLIWSVSVLIIGIITWRWRSMLTSTLSPDLAYASGLNPRREQMVLTLLLAGLVAVAVKVVGALLITALLIIPAAAARSFSSTPERMVLASAGIGAVSALGGLQAALWGDTPVGPTIVSISVLIFAISAASSGPLKRLRRGYK